MAKLRVHEWLGEDHAEAGMDWEQEAYRAGCAYARELGERRLQTLDDELMRNRPKGLRLVGSRVRTVVTRFGDVTVGRRLYRDTDGETVFLLDEYLGWKPQQQASPSITESIVGMAAQMPFRVVTEVVSALTAGVLSKSSVHRMVQGVGQDALDEDRERWEAQFERGEEMSEGRQRSDILYTEADGVWIHLQREARKHYEVKSGIAYSGWRRVAQERYELVGKRVYVHGDDTIPFWEGASLEWSKQYALDKVKQFVVGGDGAAWIGRGTEEFGNAVFQLDGFHLSRACGRGYGADIGPAIYEAIRSGSHDYARALISAAPARRDRNSDQGRRVRRVEPGQRSGLAQPCPHRAGRRSEPGDYGVQRGQTHCEPHEKARDELDHTRCEPNGQDGPTEPQRRAVEVLSQQVGSATALGEAASAPARPICEHNSDQPLGRSVSTRVERPPQLQTVGDRVATLSSYCLLIWDRFESTLSLA